MKNYLDLKKLNAIDKKKQALYKKCGGSDECQLTGKDCPYHTVSRWKEADGHKNSSNRTPCSLLTKEITRIAREALGETNVQPPKNKDSQIDIFALYDTLSSTQKEIVNKQRLSNFCGEHTFVKYDKFLGYIRKNKTLLDNIERILVIGPGSPLEYDKKGNAFKSEIIPFVEVGYGHKIEMIGLKGKDLQTSATKDIKYCLWKELGVKINRQWIDEKVNIPFSNEKTLTIILYDGLSLLQDTTIIERIIANRPQMKNMVILTYPKSGSSIRGIDFSKLDGFGKRTLLFELKTNPPYMEYWDLKINRGAR